MDKYKFILIFCLLLLLIGCKGPEPKTMNNRVDSTEVVLKVTATAYNALEGQTKKGNFRLAAWGDFLDDDVQSIAVSRDLISMGLSHNEEIEIEGLDGTFVVKDKMHRRWKKHIDIFMGLDEEAAKEWGLRQVKIRFSKTPDKDLSLINPK